ncbi:GtrA family protein [Vibrio syngnathi]|uniref:GtrA-like protein n=1 Tax=Vibrio syngnathi TaxID=3034029 RepID=A0AA34TR59_9VIBR|nr:GtrA family protein [Vibrio syngnathi]ARP39449.1 GtrA-like protein [Vibrio syngnathi]
MNKTTYKNLPVDLRKFVFVGVGAVAIDTISYLFLSGLIDYSIAKGVSFLLGSIFAYLMNNYWTFEVGKVTGGNISKFTALYFTSLGLNVSVNGIVNEQFQMYYLAFILATGTSTIINYLGQKFWVFAND